MAPKRTGTPNAGRSGSVSDKRIKSSNSASTGEEHNDIEDNQVEHLIESNDAIMVADPGPVNITSEDVSTDANGRVLGPFLEDELLLKDWGLQTDLNKRVNTMMTWSDPRNAISCPAKFPKNGYWATKYDNDFSEYFHDTKRRIPVTLWIVARLSALYLFRADGNPERQANVVFTPLNNADLTVLKSLLRSHTHQTLYGPWDGLNTLKAGKWMNHRVPGEAKPFLAVYDATTVLRSKSKMSAVPAQNLKRGDLVLLEVYLNRYRDKTMDAYVSPGRGGQRAVRTPTNSADTKWRACLVLKAICLLDDTDYVDTTSDGTERSDEDTDLAI
ncbi:hypothetical protein CALCODRAFT_479590 [Calocera cornea HHB12733]|uniref:Uncharacterized protein n=1 Tax=Calocera cornea HHB12733 TaxID=1353952 RepID=A0A165JGS1_9BASI|nr:hypothetical protein CALCODRAFT_479590 [Calocera cornea HHB12733]